MRLPDLSKLQNSWSLYLNSSENLEEIQGVLRSDDCNSVTLNFWKNLLTVFQRGYVRDTILPVPGGEVPIWFDNRTMGPLIFLQVPGVLGRKVVQGLIICAICVAHEGTDHGLFIPGAYVHSLTLGYSYRHIPEFCWIRIYREAQMWICY
nr:TPA_asm: hypothetical protein HUJ06_007134 [Nelumbo nucifera]